MIVSSERVEQAFALLKRRELPPSAWQVDHLPPARRSSVLMQRRAEADRLRLTVDAEPFQRLGMRREDFAELVDGGLVELVEEVDTRYPDRESGRPVEVPVTYVVLTELGRRSVAMVSRAPVEEFWAQRRREVAETEAAIRGRTHAA